MAPTTCERCNGTGSYSERSYCGFGDGPEHNCPDCGGRGLPGGALRLAMSLVAAPREVDLFSTDRGEHTGARAHGITTRKGTTAMQLPETIKALRQQCGMAQYKLAVRAGITIDTLRKLERQPIEQLRLNRLRDLLHGLGFALDTDVREDCDRKEEGR